METDTILLKGKLDFHQYQLAAKALADTATYELEQTMNYSYLTSTRSESIQSWL